MPQRSPARRRTAGGLVLLTALATVGTLLTSPAQAASPAGRGLPAECADTEPLTCHIEVEPGTYRVTVWLGGAEAGATGVSAETRRTMVPETVTEPGEVVRRTFTVDVRDPQGQPTDPAGEHPGLDLRFVGSAPQLAGLRVTPAPRTPQVLLIGDSTVNDQRAEPYTGWGQELPQFFRDGVSVANHADSGESTQSFLDNPQLFDALEPRVDRGDLVLIQLAHNDKTTTRDQYRANLTEMVERVQARDGDAVLVTPVVRRRFDGDGRLNSVALHVTGQADLPAETRSLAQELDVPLIDLTALTQELVEGLGETASRDLYLTDVNGDNTHTSVHGARTFAGLVLDELRDQRLVPGRVIR
ncbi:rhamnogalacturonan acetylesterase [Streptomyces sp. DSM 44915]|uniref:Rhamnogalacturonan acetylesterase n=1 Tax=Streptomyces chisholmiae TaxID=3075540 RepID=A0ABU2JVS8_9ACTN|nr:rhamnogalacturonan acetylesterase [Streptomyces sp. DSM 44915]MDT0269100.1 rhamnogalacturonan acetylesterase [Streptomyces sp. DSM 44915]